MSTPMQSVRLPPVYKSLAPWNRSGPSKSGYFTRGGLYLAIPQESGLEGMTFMIKAPGEKDTARCFALNSDRRPGQPLVTVSTRTARSAPIFVWMLITEPGVVSPQIEKILRETEPLPATTTPDTVHRRWVKGVLTMLRKRHHLSQWHDMDVLFDQFGLFSRPGWAQVPILIDFYTHWFNDI